MNPIRLVRKPSSPRKRGTRRETFHLDSRLRGNDDFGVSEQVY